MVASDGVVRHYSATGRDLGIFASGLAGASWITADPSGNVYVVDYPANQVHKYAATGEEFFVITTPYVPGGVAIGPDGSIFVAHYTEGRIHRYGASGADQGVIFDATILCDGVSSPCSCDTVSCRMDYMIFGPDRNLYVTDFDSGLIRRISTTGQYLGNYCGTRGVTGIAFGPDGTLYSANFNTGVIGKCAPFAQPGTYGIAVGPHGTVYSSAGDPQGQIRAFSRSGHDRRTFGIGGRDLVVVPAPPSAAE